MILVALVIFIISIFALMAGSAFGIWLTSNDYTAIFKSIPKTIFGYTVFKKNIICYFRRKLNHIVIDVINKILNNSKQFDSVCQGYHIIHREQFRNYLNKSLRLAKCNKYYSNLNTERYLGKKERNLLSVLTCYKYVFNGIKYHHNLALIDKKFYKHSSDIGDILNDVSSVVKKSFVTISNMIDIDNVSKDIINKRNNWRYAF